MSDSWKADLKDFGTDHIKKFLEVAPYLIVVFKKVFDLDDDENKSQNYYVNESVGIACGFFNYRHSSSRISNFNPHA